jgi:hypothetical protein
MSRKKEIENLNRQLQEIELRCSLLTKQLDKKDKTIHLKNGVSISPFETGEGIYIERNGGVEIILDNELEDGRYGSFSML